MLFKEKIVLVTGSGRGIGRAIAIAFAMEGANIIINYVHNQHKHYASNHILLTMGMDFQYQAAHTWYKNLDKLIAYVNTNFGESEKLFLMYSMKRISSGKKNFLDKEPSFNKR
jgi:NAD(P)-dependent dehydrogenase (short-subunit alcohol dehydrogenase family)